MSLRLRQVVLVAADLDATVAAIRAATGAGEPFHDPGVALFGLSNAVMGLGDTFIEVVSPIVEDTAAGRWRERLGSDGGYMVMFDSADRAGARDRAAAAGVRIAWEIELDDIAGTHFHPADTGGAIVSVDQPAKPGEWRWAGEDWRERSGSGAVVGATIAVPDPEAVAVTWAAVLGAPAPGCTFVEGERGLVEIAVDGALADAVELGGVRFVPAG